jgi:hypothetical protein
MTSKTNAKAIMTYNNIFCALSLLDAPAGGMALLLKAGAGGREAGAARKREAGRGGGATVCIKGLGRPGCAWEEREATCMPGVFDEADCPECPGCPTC